eukprot:scaffold20758_cov19-Prasinocladus_malaysianus.AAC.1
MDISPKCDDTIFLVVVPVLSTTSNIILPEERALQSNSHCHSWRSGFIIISTGLHSLDRILMVHFLLLVWFSIKQRGLCSVLQKTGPVHQPQSKPLIVTSVFDRCLMMFKCSHLPYD